MEVYSVSVVSTVSGLWKKSCDIVGVFLVQPLPAAKGHARATLQRGIVPLIFGDVMGKFCLLCG